MTATRQQIIDTARTWMETPFRHQGRTKGVAVDCAGLLIGVAHALGLSDFDARDYSPNPDGVTMKATLDAQMISVPFRHIKAGDVFYMAFKKQPQHMAIITRIDKTHIIHADSLAAGGGRVVEHRLDSVWLSRVRGCYRFHGVID